MSDILTIYSSDFSKIDKIDHPFFLVLKTGEPLILTLEACVEALKIPGGTVSGIGAVMDLTVGYYRLARSVYVKQHFAGEYEMLSLNGNFSERDGKLFAHVHVVVADEEYRAFGGHLFSATVAATAELLITPFSSRPQREAAAQGALALMSSDVA